MPAYCILDTANSPGSTTTTTVLIHFMLGLTQVVLTAKEAGPYYNSQVGRKAATTGLNSMRVAVSASVFTATGHLLKSSKHFTDPLPMAATGSVEGASTLPRSSDVTGIKVGSADAPADAPASALPSAVRAAVLAQAKQLRDLAFISKLDQSSCAPFALQFFAEESTWPLTLVCINVRVPSAQLCFCPAATLNDIVYLLSFLLQLQKYLSTDSESAELLVALDMAMVLTQSAARSVAAASLSGSPSKETEVAAVGDADDAGCGVGVAATASAVTTDTGEELKKSSKKKAQKPTTKPPKQLKRQRVEAAKDSPCITIGMFKHY
jgi:hypothetical protein